MSELDPRQVRTRAALHDAILVLAASTPTRSISMAALAREAGVNRSTVYQHYRSPAALLASVLLGELDVLRHTLLADRGPAEGSQRRVIFGVLEHLERHRCIYLRELTDPASELPAMLREHFEVSSRSLMQTSIPMPSKDPTTAAFLQACAPTWIAAASVAAMTAWLAQDERDPEAYFQAHRLLRPAWWP